MDSLRIFDEIERICQNSLNYHDHQEFIPSEDLIVYSTEDFQLLGEDTQVLIRDISRSRYFSCFESKIEALVKHLMEKSRINSRTSLDLSKRCEELVDSIVRKEEDIETERLIVSELKGKIEELENDSERLSSLLSEEKNRRLDDEKSLNEWKEKYTSLEEHNTKIQQELRNFEISQATLSNLRDSAEIRSVRVEEDLINAKQTNAVLENQNSNLKDSIQAKDSEIQSLCLKIEELEKEILRLEIFEKSCETLAIEKQDIQNQLESECESLRSSKASLEAQIEEINSSLQDQSSEQQDYRNQINQIQDENLRILELLEIFKNDSVKYEELWIEAKNNVDNLEAQSKDYQQEIAALRNEKDHFQQQLDNEKVEQRSLQVEIDTKQKNLESLQLVQSSLQQKLVDLEQIQSSLEKDRVHLMEENTRLQSSLQSYEADMKTLKELIGTYDPYHHTERTSSSLSLEDSMQDNPSSPSSSSSASASTSSLLVSSSLNNNHSVMMMTSPSSSIPVDVDRCFQLTSHPSSLTPEENQEDHEEPSDVIYLEIGCYTSRIGIWNQEQKSLAVLYSCPSIFAMHDESKSHGLDELIRGASLMADGCFQQYRDTGLFVGSDAYYCLYQHPDPTLRSLLIEKMIITSQGIPNKRAFELFVNHLLWKGLQCQDFGNYQVLFSYKLAWSHVDLEVISETLFERLCCQKVCFLNEAAFLGASTCDHLVDQHLNSSEISCLQSVSALIVDIGANSTSIYPSYEGIIVRRAVRTCEIGGEQITQHLEYLLQQSQGELEGFSSHLPRRRHWIARMLKEQACYVAADFDAECQKYGRFRHRAQKVMNSAMFAKGSEKKAEIDHNNNNNNMCDIPDASPEEEEDSTTTSGSKEDTREKIQQLEQDMESDDEECKKAVETIRKYLSVDLPDGKSLEFALDRQRFYGPEILFHPNIWEGSQGRSSLMTMLLDSYHAIEDSSAQNDICGRIYLTGKTAQCSGLFERLTRECHACHEFSSSVVSLLQDPNYPSNVWKGAEIRLCHMDQVPLETQNFVTLGDYGDLGSSVLSTVLIG